MSGPDEGPAPNPDQLPQGDVDQAWRTLGIVNDWVRHAETKAALTITASGVMAGVLFNVLKETGQLCTCATVLAVVSGVLLVTSAALAGCALWPRLESTGEPTSKLYFDHIARKYSSSTAGDAFIESFRAATSSEHRMFSEVSSQIWANSRVAAKKFKWSSWGLVTVLLALGALALTLVAILFS